MGAADLAEQLTEQVGKDNLRFGRLLEICEQELACLRAESLEGLEVVLAEKEKLIGEIQRSDEEAAPLWTRLEGAETDPNALGRLEEEMAHRKGLVERIQLKEAAIAESLSRRNDQIRRSMESLRQGGRVNEAYRPTRTYMPRFVDKRE